MKTTILDLVGVICLGAFAFFVWWPLPLLVVAIAALADLVADVHAKR